MNRRAALAGSLVAALLGLLAAAVYWGSLHNPFVYDDWQAIAHNASVHDWRDWRFVLAGSQRPVVNYSYAIDWAIAGAAPFAFHVTNVLIHALNVVLLFCLLWKRPRVAAGAAALFAVHPLLTESVSYLGARAGLLCATFLLGGTLALARGIERGRRGLLVVAAVCWLLGLGCKETAAMLPLVYVLYDYWVAESDPTARRRRLWMFHLPLLSVSALAGFARLWIHSRLEHGASVLSGAHVLAQAEVVWRYLLLFAAPVSQTVRHAPPPVPLWHSWLALAGLGALLVLAWRARRAAPDVAFGAAWFFLFLAPSSVVALSEPMAEHRVYEAAAGVFLVAACALARLPSRSWAAVNLALLAALSVGTVARNRVWADPIALWQEAALNAPDDWGPHYALGDAFREANDCARAEPEYRRAIALRPTESRTHVNRGICLAQLGRYDEAQAAFEAARALYPRSAAIYHNLGTLAAARDRIDEARADFKQALAIDPAYAPSRRALADLDSPR